jgi:hypothetical protein
MPEEEFKVLVFLFIGHLIKEVKVYATHAASPAINMKQDFHGHHMKLVFQGPALHLIIPRR